MMHGERVLLSIEARCWAVTRVAKAQTAMARRKEGRHTWPEWGQNPEIQRFVGVVGQPPATQVRM
jgi:hypothetical protein